MWPVFLFLRGEVERLRGEPGRARDNYRKLAEWAATDPYHDGWGTTGLVAPALWRWLEVLGTMQAPDLKEVNSLLDVQAQLTETRLVRRMFEMPILTATPQLEEDIVRRAASLAWSTGMRERAQRLFLDYVSIASTADLGSVEANLQNQILASKLASSDRLTLLRGKRLFARGRYDESLALLSKAGTSSSPQVRAEANLYLANVRRIKNDTPRTRAQVIDLYTAVLKDAADPDVAQEALFRRGLLFNHEGEGQNIQKFAADMEHLVKEFPHGRRAGDALYELGRYYQNTGKVDQAVRYYAQLRGMSGPNTWLGLASFQSAMALYTRAGPGDLRQASAILRELETRQPFGPMHFAALFWLGRIAAETGAQTDGAAHFQRIIKESPYGYYAVRARMHLHLGDRARRGLWPDPETRRGLRSEFERSQVDAVMTESSAYHLRFRDALKTGLYAQALAGERELRKRFPSRRLEDLTLGDLEETGLLANAMVLMALRQDAFAAKDVLSSAANRVKIAGAAGQVAKDWPLAMHLITASGDPDEERAAAQRDEHYARTAYPSVFRNYIEMAGAKWHVRPELLYSVIRLESLFNPQALSPAGALGLFQFTVPTFEVLNRRWNLLASSGKHSREAFLLDADLSINLGARWFAQELLPARHGNILLALMEHNAGGPTVSGWEKTWQRLGRAEDLEYMVDTVGFLETRAFVQRVLADMVIIDAGGILH